MGTCPTAPPLVEEDDESEDPIENDSYEWIPKENHINDIRDVFTNVKILKTGAVSLYIGEMISILGEMISIPTKYIIKELKRDDKQNININAKAFKQQVHILSALQPHQHILKYHTSYITPKYFYIITERPAGPTLFNKIRKLNSFSEQNAANLLKTLIKTIQYCHSKNIVHRDLRAENILFDTEDDESDLIIIGFRDATCIDDNEVYSEVTGKTFYLPPEITGFRTGRQLKKSDMWSIGVIAFILVTGTPPFDGVDDKEILKKIVRGNIKWPHITEIKISMICKNFIRSLLNKNIWQRLSPSQALKHPFLTGKATKEDLNEYKKYSHRIDDFYSADLLNRFMKRSDQVYDGTGIEEILIRRFIKIDKKKGKNAKGFMEANDVSSHLLRNSKLKLSTEDAETMTVRIMELLDPQNTGKILLQQDLLSDNEFDNDIHSQGTYSRVSRHELRDRLFNEMPELIDKHDKHIVFAEYDMLNRLNTLRVSGISSEWKEEILLDSMIKVYSPMEETYIDFGGILTKDRLYFISTVNYKLWEEIRCRTKIDKLISANDEKIGKTLAIKLANCLDLTDDENINETVVIPYFSEKTLKQIQLDILLNANRLLSLPVLFGLADKDIKTVNKIMITNFFNENIISSEKTAEFIDELLKGISWTDDDIHQCDKLVTLKKYHYKFEILNELNDRKNKYCQRNNIIANSIQIKEINIDSMTPYSKFKIVELSKYTKIDPLTYHQTGYGLELTNNTKIDTITCQLETNNCRHEWITYLDLIVNKLNNKQIQIQEQENQFATTKTHSNLLKKTTTTIQLMNDFTDTNNEEEFATKFSFGEYLNYWQSKYENSVSPTHPTLKQELLNNTIATISADEYYELCEKYKDGNFRSIKAKNIGINNRKFNIAPGSAITINHIISLKIYTDYTDIQNKFKKYCRKYNAKETISEFIKRNSKIAHWCRYLKESCMFYGETMSKNERLYTGLTIKLLFGSLSTHFECPLSTTMLMSVAQRFSEDGQGIILSLKPANIKTRYFNVSWLSQFDHEEERLIVGASLKISDIYIGYPPQSLKVYIDAIEMFEHIIKGQFINQTVKQNETEETLCKLMLFCAKPTLLDSLQQYIATKQMNYLSQFLINEEYDSDSIQNDLMVLQEDSSNISFILQDVTSSSAIKEFLSISEKQYIIALFRNMIDQMVEMNRTGKLWINVYELNNIQHTELKHLWKRNDGFLEYYGIDISNIKKVQQYEWNIEGDEYEKFKNMKARKYLKSKEYKCAIGDNEEMSFYLECCAKYTEGSEQCGLFLCLDVDKLPVYIQEIKIEMDIIGQNKKKYRYQMAVQKLSAMKQYCGSQIFPSSDLQKNNSIKWRIGMKVIEKIYSQLNSTLRAPLNS
eukprot:179369_1